MSSENTVKPYVQKLMNNLEKEKEWLAKCFYKDSAIQKYFIEWLEHELDLMMVVHECDDRLTSANWTTLAEKVEALCADRHDYDGRGDIAKIIHHFNRPIKGLASKFYNMGVTRPKDEKLLTMAFFTLIGIYKLLISQKDWSGMIRIIENVEHIFKLPKEH